MMHKSIGKKNPQKYNLAQAIASDLNRKTREQ